MKNSSAFSPPFVFLKKTQISLSCVLFFFIIRFIIRELEEE